MPAAKKRPRRAGSGEPAATRPVRLELGDADHVRLAAVAKARGLSKASYARQAVLVAIRADEGRG